VPLIVHPPLGPFHSARLIAPSTWKLQQGSDNGLASGETCSSELWGVVRTPVPRWSDRHLAPIARAKSVPDGGCRYAATGSRRAATRAARVPNTVIVTTPSTASRPTVTVPDQPPAWNAIAPTVLPALEPM
jgi:hypothetical protein